MANLMRQPAILLSLRATRGSALLIIRRSQSRTVHSQNRIYNSIRNQDDFQTLVALSTSNNVPLITFWTASWCPTCRLAGPLIREIIEDPDGQFLSKDVRVGFAEVELDAPDVGYGMGTRYMIRSIPTLLAFRRGFPQTEKALSRTEDLTNRQTLARWIEDVASQGGEDRSRKGLFSSLWGQ